MLVAVVDNDKSKQLAAATFKIPCSSLVNKFPGRHSKSMGCPTILIHDEEQYFPKIFSVVLELEKQSIIS